MEKFSTLLSFFSQDSKLNTNDLTPKHQTPETVQKHETRASYNVTPVALDLQPAED